MCGFVSKYLRDFANRSLFLFLVKIYFNLREDIKHFYSLKSNCRSVLCTRLWSTLENVPCELEGVACSAVWEVVHRNPLDASDFLDFPECFSDDI